MPHKRIKGPKFSIGDKVIIKKYNEEHLVTDIIHYMRTNTYEYVLDDRCTAKEGTLKLNKEYK